MDNNPRKHMRFRQGSAPLAPMTSPNTTTTTTTSSSNSNNNSAPSSQQPHFVVNKDPLPSLTHCASTDEEFADQEVVPIIPGVSPNAPATCSIEPGGDPMSLLSNTPSKSGLRHHNHHNLLLGSHHHHSHQQGHASSSSMAVNVIERAQRLPTWAWCLFVLLFIVLAFFFALSFSSKGERTIPMRPLYPSGRYCTTVGILDEFETVYVSPTTDFSVAAAPLGAPSASESSSSRSGTGRQSSSSSSSSALSSSSVGVSNGGGGGGDGDDRSTPAVVVPRLLFSHLSPNLTVACGVPLLFDKSASVVHFSRRDLLASCIGAVINQTATTPTAPREQIFIFNTANGELSAVAWRNSNGDSSLNNDNQNNKRLVAKNFEPCDRPVLVPPGVYVWRNAASKLFAQTVTFTFHRGTPFLLDIATTDGSIAGKPKTCGDIAYRYSPQSGQITLGRPLPPCLGRVFDFGQDESLRLMYFHPKLRRVVACFGVNTCIALDVSTLF